ncbi:MAG: hypothetical protein M1831_007513 [Alyxoria varia]|nr:MAG: hypothetical protein M1831_007513 [Alyxoria varia]
MDGCPSLRICCMNVSATLHKNSQDLQSLGGLAALASGAGTATVEDERNGEVSPVSE